jgi:hypothetical protein
VRGLFLTAVALECVLLAAETIEVLLRVVLWVAVRSFALLMVFLLILRLFAVYMVFRLKVVLLVGVLWLGLWMVDLFVGVLFPFFPIVRGGALFLLRVRGG